MRRGAGIGRQRRAFLLYLICFASRIEGLFFFAAFAYVYFLRSKGLPHGLASGANWVFRDESMHMAFSLTVDGLIAMGQFLAASAPGQAVLAHVLGGRHDGRRRQR
jgi:hypothetical protein